jgi:hypothetical protein
MIDPLTYFEKTVSDSCGLEDDPFLVLSLATKNPQKYYKHLPLFVRAKAHR